MKIRSASGTRASPNLTRVWQMLAALSWRFQESPRGRKQFTGVGRLAAE